MADQCIPSQDAEQRSEGRTLDADLQELSTRSLNLPVLVLSEDKSLRGGAPRVVAAWQQVQASLLNLSPRTYRVVARDSNHFLQITSPRFTVEGISVSCVSMARARRSPTGRRP